MIMSNCHGTEYTVADEEGKGTENLDGNRIDRIQADGSHVPVHVRRICDVQDREDDDKRQQGHSVAAGVAGHPCRYSEQLLRRADLGQGR